MHCKLYKYINNDNGPVPVLKMSSEQSTASHQSHNIQLRNACISRKEMNNGKCGSFGAYTQTSVLSLCIIRLWTPFVCLYSTPSSFIRSPQVLWSTRLLPSNTITLELYTRLSPTLFFRSIIWICPQYPSFILCTLNALPVCVCVCAVSYTHLRAHETA